MRPALLFALLLAACGGADEPSADLGELRIRAPDRAVTLDVEIADDADERATGLMGRERLEPLDGMAFIWDEPVRSSFWMKDTLIPLDILFFDKDRKLVSMQLNVPPCKADPCPSYPSNAPALYVLELPAGTAVKIGAGEGDRMTIEGTIGHVEP